MVVCFIGHRTVTDTLQVKIRLTETVVNLIADGAETFLFGSRSDFDTLCWEVVSELKKQYTNIKRISHNAPHETAFTSIEERQLYEQIYLQLTGNEVHFKDYDYAVNSQKCINSTKNTYIMRNQEMIDKSDVCVFYYNKDYLPPKRKQSKRHVLSYQPQSGTAIALTYAKQKKKKIINLFYSG